MDFDFDLEKFVQWYLDIQNSWNFYKYPFRNLPGMLYEMPKMLQKNLPEDRDFSNNLSKNGSKGSFSFKSFRDSFTNCVGGSLWTSTKDSFRNSYSDFFFEIHQKPFRKSSRSFHLKFIQSSLLEEFLFARQSQTFCRDFLGTLPGHSARDSNTKFLIRFFLESLS